MGLDQPAKLSFAVFDSAALSSMDTKTIYWFCMLNMCLADFCEKVDLGNVTSPFIHFENLVRKILLETDLT